MISQRSVFRLFSRLNIGGPAIHVVNLAVGLSPLGYNTTLVVGSPDKTEGSMEQYARSRNAKLYTIPQFQAAISPLKDAITFVKLIFLFIRHRPSIVHTHTFKAGILGRTAAWLTRIPVIVHTYHGHLLSGYWSKRNTKILVWIEKQLNRFTHQAIAVSQKVAEDLILSGAVEKKRIKVVELGFEMPSILNQLSEVPSLRRDLNIGPHDVVIGIVGRLVPIKAVDLFLKAAGPLLEQVSNVHLAVIGDGVELARLKEIAASFSKDRIHFCGWRIPVIPDLKDLDLCICSSLNEGTSVSIIEAVIAKVPVISTNVGGMSDLLGGGQWGTLVDCNETALRQAIANFIKIKGYPLSTSEQRQMETRCEMASNHFRKRFSLERLLHDIDHLYQNLEKERLPFISAERIHA